MEKTLRSKIVFECPVFNVEEAEVELPDGSVQKRWYVVNPDAVLVMPIDGKGNIVLIKEWASAAQKKITKLVAGKIDPGEDPIVAAQRELREETGYGAKSLEFVGNIPAQANWQKQNKYFFVATDLYDAPLQGDEFEKAELLPTSFDDVIQKIEVGELRGDIAVALRQLIFKNKK